MRREPPKGVDPAEWLNTKQAIALLGMCRYKFMLFLERGGMVIPHFYYKKSRYYLKEELLAWKKKYAQLLARKEKRHDSAAQRITIIG